MLVNHSKQRALSGTVYSNDQDPSGITLTTGAIAGMVQMHTVASSDIRVNYRKRCQDPHSVAHVH